MSRFDFIPTSLAGLISVQRKVTEDPRGFFSRFYCVEEFAKAGINLEISQINQTLTFKMGAVRGLHFQYPPYTETKLVSCVRGEIFDVAVDLRYGSPTFLRSHAEILSAENRRSLVIPQGCAHGFQALTNHCELIYLHSAPYRREAEGALNVADPKLNIAWPLPVRDLSDRDRSHAFIGEAYQGIIL